MKSHPALQGTLILWGIEDEAALVDTIEAAGFERSERKGVVVLERDGGLLNYVAFAFPGEGRLIAGDSPYDLEPFVGEGFGEVDAHLRSAFERAKRSKQDALQIFGVDNLRVRRPRRPPLPGVAVGPDLRRGRKFQWDDTTVYAFADGRDAEAARALIQEEVDDVDEEFAKVQLAREGSLLAINTRWTD